MSKKAIYRHKIEDYELDIKETLITLKTDNKIDLEEVLKKSEMVGFYKSRLSKKERKQIEQEYEDEERFKYWW